VTRDVAAFLDQAGWGAARRSPLAGDASSRRYERLIDGARRAVLMDAPPPEDVSAFLRIADLLRGLGLSAPAALAADVKAGLLLLEDFGDAVFSRLLDEGASPEPLYDLAVDALVALRRRFAPIEGLRRYDLGLFLDQLALYPEMFGGDGMAFLDAWRAPLAAALAEPSSLLLRDYHAGNLLLLPHRDGVARCGLLDFQDAGLGPCAYDLVSLLEDARRDLPEALKERCLARYSAAAPLDMTALGVLGAMRHVRVLAVFERLARAGKPAYLAHVPRVRRLLEAHLARAELAPVRRWFERFPQAAPAAQ
jgi:aminoglycoside/choline kinase family phosphotransferase